MANEHAGAELWLAAGERLLGDGGVRAVKLPALAAAVGLTTGSFYHHFRNMTDFLDRLAVRCAGPAEHRVPPGDHPRERLRAELVAQWSMVRHGMGGALRDWSTSSDAARRAVLDGDAVVLGGLHDSFVEWGADDVAARARAVLALSIGVVRVTPPWSAGEGLATFGPERVDAVLDALMPRSAR